jgi:hypothetical protein
MIPRRGRALVLAIACALSLPLAASAASRHLQPLPPGTAFHPGPPATEGVCQLGIVGSTVYLADLYPPDDAYYMLLDPTTCGACSLTTLANVHVSLEFRSSCSLRVWVSLVPIAGTTCPLPDALHPLVPSIDTTLTADPGVTEFVIPVPATWKLNGRSFLAVGFPAFTDSCSSPSDQPRLSETDGCEGCTSYERFEGTYSDVCDGGSIPLISAEIAECQLTPTLRQSWGSIKVLYR